MKVDYLSIELDLMSGNSFENTDFSEDFSVSFTGIEVANVIQGCRDYVSQRWRWKR